MIGHKIILILFILTLAFTFISVDLTSANTAMDESGITAFLKANPQAIIIDVRWEQIYEQGHLPGANLIDSSLSDQQKQSITDQILVKNGATYSTPIILYCNCRDGDQASALSNYLAGKGYTNTVWLETSFSLWQNYSMLVGGSDSYGKTLTTKPNFGSSTSFSIDPILAFSMAGIIVVGVGTFIYYRNQQHPGKNTQQILKHAEKKQTAELDSLQELIKQRKEQTANKNMKKKGKT